MHSPNFVLLLLGISSLTLGQTADSEGSEPSLEPVKIQAKPSPTSPQDGLPDPQNGAIEPTASGEIGINPVDLPPASHAPIGVDTQYLTDEGTSTKWIGVDEWFSGSATAGAGQPDATGHAIPKGFQVSVGDDGSVEITLSQWVHDKLEAIAEGLPACPAKRRRQDVSACTRRRTYQFAEEIAQDSELMEQIEGLSSELAQGVGGEGYAAELVEGGETLTFGGAELVGEVLKSLGAIKQISEASPVAVGVFGSVVLSAVSFNGVLKSGDKAGPMSWKFGAGKPEAIPVPGPEDEDEDEAGCAKDDDEKIPCGSVKCEGPQDGDDRKCTVGKYKDCPCVPDPEEFIQSYFEEWDEVENLFGAVTDKLEVECDPQGDPTGLPESLFRGGIYDKYCEELEKDMGKGVTWVVDHKGEQVPEKARRGAAGMPLLSRANRPRSPPVREDDYEGYIIELDFKPTEDGGACPESCTESLLRVSNSQCGHSGPHQNTMAGESKYDALCGKYTISVSAPENPPPRPTRTKGPPLRETPTQECWPSDLLGDHGPVDGDEVKERAKAFCDRDETLKYGKSVLNEAAGDDRYGGPSEGTWMTFAATWDKDVCDKDHDPVSVLHPEGLGNCENILYQNWRQCDNGGAGGHIQIGCVRYIFWPWGAFEDRDAHTFHDLIRNPP